MSYKMFDNNLVGIHENKVILMLNKPSYIGMCYLELSKALMCKFHYDYVKNKCCNNSRLFFTVTDSLMYELKTKYIYKDFSNDKEMSLLIIIQNIMILWYYKSKYYENSNKLVVDKMKDETADVAIYEFAGLKLKMYSYLVDDNSEHRILKSLNKNVVATISHDEYKNVLLN